MVKAVQIWTSSESLQDPDGPLWSGIEKQRVTLLASPIISQPSEYVQNKWATLKWGITPEVRVAAAHNGKSVFFRLEWDDVVEDRPTDTADFPDQCGVMMPLKNDALIAEMGAPDLPVCMWLWRADIPSPRYVIAQGRGTTKRYPEEFMPTVGAAAAPLASSTPGITAVAPANAESPLTGTGVWNNGVWKVVLSRPFNVNVPAALTVPLAPGLKHKCTFAVWQGSNKERAGLKAYQPLWQPLEIES